MITKLLSLMMLGVVVLTGCGYTTGSLLPSTYQNIYVAPVENTIDYLNQNERTLYVPGLETRVRGSVIDRFLFDGRLRVGEPDSADLVLTAKLLSFEREELRLNNNEDVREYRIRITVSLTMVDPADQTVLWAEPSFSGETTYFVTASESAAIDEALKDLSLRIVARTVEDW